MPTTIRILEGYRLRAKRPLSGVMRSSAATGDVRGTGGGRSGSFLLLGQAACALVTIISPPHPVSCPGPVGIAFRRPDESAFDRPDDEPTPRPVRGRGPRFRKPPVPVASRHGPRAASEPPRLRRPP